jgi:hypothetical protein
VCFAEALRVSGFALKSGLTHQFVADHHLRLSEPQQKKIKEIDNSAFLYYKGFTLMFKVSFWASTPVRQLAQVLLL